MQTRKSLKHELGYETVYKNVCLFTAFGKIAVRKKMIMVYKSVIVLEEYELSGKLRVDRIII